MSVFSHLTDHLPFAHHPHEHVTELDITLQNVSYAYTNDARTSIRALQDVSCSFTAKTRRTAIIGLNGSGKSTLLSLLANECAPTAGTRTYSALTATSDTPITIDAASHDGMHMLRDAIGMVHQSEIPSNFTKYPSIRKAYEAMLKKRHMPSTERLATTGNVFAHFDLGAIAHLPVDALNNEQRHMLSLAIAMSTNPALLIADEPTKGLDEIAALHVANALFSTDIPLIFATHSIELIERAEYQIDRVLVLDDGQIVFDGPSLQATSYYTELIRSKYTAMMHRNDPARTASY